MAAGGLDIGTSSCKMAVFSEKGEVICESRSSYREYGSHGIREIKPTEVWESVLKVLSDIADRCPEKLEGFAVTSLGESFIAVDAYDTPLNCSMVTGDKRGAAEAKELAAKFGRDELMRVTGVPPSEMYALPKMMWTSRNTDIFKQAKYLFMYEDYVAYCLTGQREISYSSAARSMAFDIRRKEWSESLLSLADLSVGKLSRPVPSGKIIGTLKREICELSGLSEETVLIAGGHDQMCAALGNGVFREGTCGDGMGTCEVMTSIVSGEMTAEVRAKMMEYEMAYVPYLGRNSYLTYLVMTNCGSLMNWYRDTFLQEKYLSEEIRKRDRFFLLDEEAAEDPTGLLVIPNFGSAGNPHVDYTAKGIIWGVTIQTKQEEMFRAFKEGMAYQMKLCMEGLSSLCCSPQMIFASGGGAKSDLTMQIRADVFGLPVCRLADSEAGARGCMMLTRTALGEFRNEEEAGKTLIKTDRVFYPNAANHAQYLTIFEKYKRLYNMLYQFH